MELESYAQPDEPTAIPRESKSVMATHGYLAACNLMFERGLLSHHRVTAQNQHVLHNILEGYRYFENWAKELEDMSDFQPNSPRERRFLAWQTWDLLRITVSGFQGVCADFLSRHGDKHFISPLRINGSAVESLFSRLKAYTGGKLTSISYQTSRKSIIIQDETKHPSIEGYRDVPLFHHYDG
ncbi:PREDICTED: uncharacterized protein LOC106813823 [Priapulus caudatus]|uniref:Uncharacterized protein LOC106813823 n=1 Tax=Priapulus caudatus TaxID=37621 RepID=A0ABM1EMW6_PRICU|nr:PREDICTED: uncharacterized protein LOC106813823 [Priapulus caudatus]